MRKSNSHPPETGQHPNPAGHLCDCSCTGGPQHRDPSYNPTYTSSSMYSPCLGMEQDTRDNQQLLARLSAATGGKLAISVSKLAGLLSISKPAAYALVRSEGFPSFQVGGRTLVSVPGLIAWIEQASAEEVL